MDEIQSQIPKSDTSDDESNNERDEFQATQALLEEDNHRPKSSDDESDEQDNNESSNESAEFKATQELLEKDNHGSCLVALEASLEMHDIEMDGLKEYIEWLGKRDANKSKRIKDALAEHGLSLTQVKAYVWWADKKLKTNKK